MLGSRHEGEVLAAARMAHELMQAAKLTWHNVIIGATELPAPDKMSVLEMAEICAEDIEIFDAKSAAFISAILPRLRRGCTLSQKQAVWLFDLFERAYIARRRP